MGAAQRLAVTYAVVLAIVEVAYNWGNPSWWPFIAIDYVAAGLLLGGALYSARLLAAGWGFTCAMFLMALLASIEAGRPALLLAGMTAFLLIATLGLVLTLRAPREPEPEGRTEP